MVAAPIVGAGISAGADLLGGLSNAYFGKKAAKKQWKHEKKVLQNQIQWRVDDAVKAGLHPLVGAGISPSSGPAPMPVGDIGRDLSNMGQNIGRAAEAYLTPVDKVAARAALLDLEQRQANIDLTRSQIAGAQKALLSQGSTPGVASNISSIPDPLNAGSRLPVAYPGLAQDAENNFGDIFNEIYGIANWARSVYNKYPAMPAADDPGWNKYMRPGYYGMPVKSYRGR